MREEEGTRRKVEGRWEKRSEGRRRGRSRREEV